VNEIKNFTIEYFKQTKIKVFMIKDKKTLKKSIRPVNINYLLFIKIIFGFILNSFGQRDKYWITNYNSPVLHVHETCHNFEKIANERDKNYFMLNSRQHTIEGSGYLCMKTTINLKTWKNFWSQFLDLENLKRSRIC
jgi:hypothetical protein